MFQSPKKLMRTLLEVVDDMLVGEPEAPVAAEIPAPHPHRRPARVRIERRAGTVAPRPMHCVSPVRPVAERAASRDAVRGA
jgi:hypothetical protein